jgi:type IV secretion system protein VirB6/type IV secretion system protein TrbL
MPPRQITQLMIGFSLLIFIVPLAGAIPVPGNEMFGEALQKVLGIPVDTPILEAAKRLFWALATMSLVWTMGVLIVRQDIGEMLMELLRFIVVTGTFYWLLINASGSEGGGGFVDDIVSSFYQMSNGDAAPETLVTNASGILSRGLHVFYSVMKETQGGDVEDVLIAGGIATAILVICALMAAQFLVALVMAWMLSYAGIFLLGFGGARWTSQIAVSFYKHVLAIGIALLALHFIGVAASGFLGLYDDSGNSQSQRTISEFPYLGGLLAAVVLMMVLSVKLPQLLYTLVTGSPLGVFTGTATMAGHAFASGGGAAWSSAVNALPTSVGGGGGSWGGGGARAESASTRTDSVMDAVQRSASTVSSMGDPFHGGAGTDPFGAVRAADPYRKSRDGSVFAATQASITSAPSAVGEPRASTSTANTSSGGEVRRNGSLAPDEGRSRAASSHQASRLGGVLGGADESAIQAGRADLVGTEPVARPDYEAEIGEIEAFRLNTPGHTRSTQKLGLPEGVLPINDAFSGESQQRVSTPDVSIMPTDVRVDGISHIGTTGPVSVLASDMPGTPTDARVPYGERSVTGGVTHSALEMVPMYEVPSQLRGNDVAPKAAIASVDPAHVDHSIAVRSDDRNVLSMGTSTLHATGNPEQFSTDVASVPHQGHSQELRQAADSSMDVAGSSEANGVHVTDRRTLSAVSNSAQPVAREALRALDDESRTPRHDTGAVQTGISSMEAAEISHGAMPNSEAMLTTQTVTDDSLSRRGEDGEMEEVATIIHGEPPASECLNQNDMAASDQAHLSDSMAVRPIARSPNDCGSLRDAMSAESGHIAHSVIGDAGMEDIAAIAGTTGSAPGNDQVVPTQFTTEPGVEKSDNVIRPATSIPVTTTEGRSHLMTTAMAHRGDLPESRVTSSSESSASVVDASGSAATNAASTPIPKDLAQKKAAGDAPGATRIEVQDKLASSEGALHDGTISGDSAARRSRSSEAREASPLAGEAATANAPPVVVPTEDPVEQTKPKDSANIGEPQVTMRSKRRTKTEIPPAFPNQPRATRAEDDE